MKQPKKILAVFLSILGVLCIITAIIIALHYMQEDRQSQEALTDVIQSNLTPLPPPTPSAEVIY